MKFSDKEFSKLVALGVEALPLRLRQKIENIAIVISDEPTQEQLRVNDVSSGETLLGLYEGVPLTARGEYYGTGMVLPDKITIFKLPIIVEACGDAEKMEKIVRDTVWHEIAHHFGYDDDAIEKRESLGTNHSI
jgi:predicted Zn-dependent protease with MMP-like domain